MNTVFETIKDRLPITEVLSSYITVEQSGSQYKAKCPFHNERTASFHISSERGLYYCFGCGAKGDIFTFVEQFEGLDKKGALKLLADRAGVVLTGFRQEKSDLDGVYEILEKATGIYEEILKKSSGAQKYLEDRGILKETIESFRIGYAPDQWRTIESACKDESEKSFAQRAGLIKRAEGKVYDRFRKRIIFPMNDSSGRVIAFSGRSYPEEEGSPKYLNSPETEVFQKSKTLFGFDKAKLHIKKHNFSILVEGQMDLVISHQAGFKNTVASSGTAVSEDAAQDPFSNLSVLSRLSPNIFLAFDGDEAGQNAMDRAALVALSLGMNPKVVSLTEGIDPADFIKENGVDAWKEKLKESKHFIEHHLSIIRSTSQSPHIFVKNIKEKIFPFLVRVASPMERNLYITTISQETGLSPESISQELAKVPVEKPTQGENIKKTLISKSISPYERLTAIRKIFGSEKIETVCGELNNLSVGDIVFSATPIAEEVLEKSLILVEREYKHLKEVDLLKVCEELIQKVEQEFLLSSRSFYSRELKKAESQNNEQEVNRLSSLLEETTKRMHKRGNA
ncbi:MAG: DNA primase [Candidatus Pacebacteria bacterium]|nr:DNA primase [Candidatus Paceibacterota bacterium]